jgi:tetratricopeptide (TPR) repeat protein
MFPSNASPSFITVAIFFLFASFSLNSTSAKPYIKPRAFQQGSTAISLPYEIDPYTYATQGGDAVQKIEPGKPLKRQIAGAEVHVYHLPLISGQYLRLIVDQRGVDVVVRMFTPRGLKSIEVDSPNGSEGQEAFSVIAQETGIYRIEVSPFEPNAPTGLYEIKIEELRIANGSDEALIKAERLELEANKSITEGKYEHAKILLTQSIEVRRKIFSEDHLSIAVSLIKLAQLYLNTGELQKAKDVLARALSIREKAFGREDTKTAEVLTLLADLYVKTGDLSNAEVLYNRALSVFEAESATESISFAWLLYNLAQLYQEKGAYVRAEPLLQRALQILEKAQGPEDKNFVIVLNNLASLYVKKSDYARAEVAYEKTLEIYRKTGNKVYEARAMVDLARMHLEKGDLAIAEPLLKQALSVYEETVGPKHPFLAEALNELGTIKREKGEYDSAQELFERALLILEELHGENNPAVAQTLFDLANLYLNKGDYSQAEHLFVKALEINTRVLGLEHPDVAAITNSLALLYQARGDYVRSERFLRRTLNIREQVLGPDHPLVAATLESLALNYLKRDEHEYAEQLFLRVLKIREKTLGPDHPLVVVTLKNLEGIYSERGQADAGLMAKRIEEIQKRLGGQNITPGVLQELNERALKYKYLGDYGRAESTFRKGLSIAEAEFGSNHLAVVQAINNLADLYLEKADFARAEPLLQRALRLSSNTSTPTYYEIASLNNLAFLYQARGDSPRAEPLLQRVLAIREREYGSDAPLVVVSKNNIEILHQSQLRQAFSASLTQLLESSDQLTPLESGFGSVYKAEAVIQSIRIIKEQMLADLKRIEFVGLKAYIEKSFPVPSLDSLPSLRLPTGQVVISEPIKNAIISKVFTFNSKLSSSTLDRLSVNIIFNSQPSEARVELWAADVGDKKSTVTDSEIRNIYRGLYKYIVTKPGYKAARNDNFDLINEEGTQLKCKLRRENEEGESVCSMH